MQFTRTAIDGVLLIDFRRAADNRGWFSRVYDTAAFASEGLCTAFAQHGEAFNRRRGTVRGMHYQAFPHGEIKLIRCTLGAVLDVLVDLRAGPTYGHSVAIELDAERAQGIYCVAGIAHGYQTLRDDTMLHYLLSTPYEASAARGVRYDSAALGIAWPIADPILSERDRGLPEFAVTDPPQPRESR